MQGACQSLMGEGSPQALSWCRGRPLTQQIRGDVNLPSPTIAVRRTASLRSPWGEGEVMRASAVANPFASKTLTRALLPVTVQVIIARRLVTARLCGVASWAPTKTSSAVATSPAPSLCCRRRAISCRASAGHRHGGLDGVASCGAVISLHGDRPRREARCQRRWAWWCWSRMSGSTTCGTPARRTLAVVPEPPWCTTAAMRRKQALMRHVVHRAPVRGQATLAEARPAGADQAAPARWRSALRAQPSRCVLCPGPTCCQSRRRSAARRRPARLQAPGPADADRRKR